MVLGGEEHTTPALLTQEHPRLIWGDTNMSWTWHFVEERKNTTTKTTSWFSVRLVHFPLKITVQYDKKKAKNKRKKIMWRGVDWKRGVIWFTSFLKSKLSATRENERLEKEDHKRNGLKKRKLTTKRTSWFCSYLSHPFLKSELSTTKKTRHKRKEII